MNPAALVALIATFFGHSPSFAVAIEPVGPSLQYLVSRPASIDARGSAFFVALDPQPAVFPNIVWALDGNAAALEADASHSAIAYVDPAAGGVATLHAYVGPPVNRAVDVQLFAYRSLALETLEPRDLQSTDRARDVELVHLFVPLLCALGIAGPPIEPGDQLLRFGGVLLRDLVFERCGNEDIAWQLEELFVTYIGCPGKSF